MGKTPHGGITVHVVPLFPAQCSVRQQLLPLNQPRWEFGVFIKYQGPLPREAVVTHWAAHHCPCPWPLLFHCAAVCFQMPWPHLWARGLLLEGCCAPAWVHPPPVNDGNQCIKTPALCTLQGDNVEASVLPYFPKFFHIGIKFQLPTMLGYFMFCFLWTALPSLCALLCWCSLPLASGPPSDSCGKGRRAVLYGRLEHVGGLLGRIKEKAEEWYPVESTVRQLAPRHTWTVRPHSWQQSKIE